jgi:biotin synthase
LPPLITQEEAMRLGQLRSHAEIEALVERAWRARLDRFGDSTDMCSLVNAKSGGCAEDCGFCAQSRYAEADTPMHAMMSPEQILEHARAAEAAGAHRFCMVTQGQGLSKRDFQNVLDGARLVAEHTNLKRCASIGHMSVERAQQLRGAGIQRVHHNVEAAESYYPEVTTTVRYEGRIRTIEAVRRRGSRPASAASSTSARPASSAWRWRSSSPSSTRPASRSTCSTRGRARSSEHGS